MLTEGFLVIQTELRYPKYFGYNPKIRGISEPVRKQSSYVKWGKGDRLKIDQEDSRV